MQEIKCPNCGEVFQVDESSYDSIAKQVRDKEFSREIEQRENYYAKEKETAVKLAQAEKDAEIAQLQAKIDSLETEKSLAINEAVAAKEKEISSQK